MRNTWLRSNQMTTSSIELPESLSVDKPRRRLTTAQQNQSKVFYFEKSKRRVRKGKKIIHIKESKKANLVNKAKKTLKAILRLECCENEISRVRKIEFLKREDEQKERRSSYKGLTEDAQVHGAEEGRDKLRKATGRSKYPMIRGYPNEGTQHE